jgi:serine/threonine-protein kinase BUR1
MEHDLAGLLENPNVTLTHSQIKLYMLQLCEGVGYLHRVRVLRYLRILRVNSALWAILSQHKEQDLT